MSSLTGAFSADLILTRLPANGDADFCLKGPKTSLRATSLRDGEVLMRYIDAPCV
jgi:hypothetical protein